MSNLYMVIHRARVWLYVYVIALTAVWAVVSLWRPFGWDQGIFAWVGDTIYRGGLPYRDAWDIKGPFALYVYAWVEFLFGRNLWGVRVLDLVLLLFAASTLGIYVRSLTNAAIGKWAALLFALWYASGSYWHTAQPDGWIAILMLTAVVLLVMVSDDWYWIAPGWAGFVVGCAILLKPLYGVFVPVVLAAILVRTPRRRRSTALSLGLFSAGLVVPVAACAGWFMAHGAWRDLVQVWLLYPLTHYAGEGVFAPQAQLQGVVEFLVSGEVIAVMLPLVGLGIFALWGQNRAHTIVIVLWLLTAALCVIVQNRFFKYHWVLVYPPVAVFCASGFYAIFKEQTEPRAFPTIMGVPTLRALGAALLLVLILHCTIRPALETVNWLAFVMQRVSTAQYYAGFGIPGNDMQAAEYIRARTNDQDRIVVWGWSIAISYLAGRQSVSRFGYSMPLLMGETTDVCNSYRQEFMAAVKATPPKYIVVGPLSDVILRKHYELEDFPEFAGFIASNYMQETQFGDLHLFRRR